MALHLLGGGLAASPFNRTFFNVAFADILERAGKERPQKLTLFLADGTTLDVCALDDLSDTYLALRAYLSEGDSCETTTHLIPYGLIYRIELAPKENASPRMGFRWSPQPRRVRLTRER